MKRILLLVCIGIAAGFGWTEESDRLVEVSIEAPVKLEKEGENTFLIVEGGGERFRRHWLYQPPDGSAVRKTVNCEIAEGQTCTFTFEGMRHGGKGGLINAQMMKVVAQDGTVLYDRMLCEVHHCKMERKSVPIIWGMPMRNPGDPDPAIEGKLFPHRREVSFGGCVVMPEKTTEMELVCPECRKAFEKWKTERK